jgi:hypothetical protein
MQAPYAILFSMKNPSLETNSASASHEIPRRETRRFIPVLKRVLLRACHLLRFVAVKTPIVVFWVVVL